MNGMFWRESPGRNIKQEDVMSIVGWYCSNNKHTEKLGHRPSKGLYRPT